MRVKSTARILGLALAAMLLLTQLPGAGASAIATVAPPQNLRFSVTPRSGPAGTRITIRSVDPCPKLGGVASQFADVTVAYFAVSDAIPTESVRASVAADGSWTAKLTVAANLTGPGHIFAGCTAPGVQARASYAAVRFDVTTLGAGYWLLSATPFRAACFCRTTANVLFAGDARDYGPRPALIGPRLVGIAPNPVTGTGYWLAASDGGVFSFGDARFFGSAARLRLAHPVVGMAATPSGRGYWLVASDGGVFGFGDARFFGSAARLRLAHPVVGMGATPSGRGYWLVASDGGVFGFGDARFFGSAVYPGAMPSVVGMAATPSGHGYWLATRTGAVFGFGDAPAEAACVEGCGPAVVVAIAGTPLTSPRNSVTSSAISD